MPATAVVCVADGRGLALSRQAKLCRGAKNRQQPCSATGLGTKGRYPAQTLVPGLLAVTGSMPLEMLRDMQ